MRFGKVNLAVVCFVMCSVGALAQIVGNGTANRVPKFTDGTSIGNSAITDLNGNVGIGVPNPMAALDVNGAIRSTGDIIPGGNGVLRGIVPLAMWGGEAYVNSPNWQTVTRTTYTDMPDFFAWTPRLLFSNRRYFLIIRKSDNYPSNGVSGEWRFSCSAAWNNGQAIAGQGGQLTGDWGSTDEGTEKWYEIPERSVKCPRNYWEIDMRMASSGSAMRVMNVSIAAVDVANGTPMPLTTWYSSDNPTYPPLSMLYDNIWTDQPGGNIGIGTNTPGAKLEVNGNIKLTAGIGGTITFSDGSRQSTAYTGVLSGGDYAESVDVTGDRAHYEPGDVLVIDPEKPGKFLKSAEPYSTFVTGIYSTKPGTVGRRQATPKSAEEVPMAMIGIVPVKVNAESGAIRPGDLLVSSSTIGYAMKGADRSRTPGAVIGKALGSLDSGTGVIEVVVTLQ